MFVLNQESQGLVIVLVLAAVALLFWCLIWGIWDNNGCVYAKDFKKVWKSKRFRIFLGLGVVAYITTLLAFDFVEVNVPEIGSIPVSSAEAFLVIGIVCIPILPVVLLNLKH